MTMEQEKAKITDLGFEIENIQKEIEFAKEALEKNASTLMKAIIILGNKSSSVILSGRPALRELELANKIKDEIPEYPSHNDLNQCASEYLNLFTELHRKETQSEQMKAKIRKSPS